MTDAPRHPCEGLSVSARATFEAIALRRPGGHSAGDLEALALYGLIKPARRGQGWTIPPKHFDAFCVWCSTQEPLS